MRASTPTSPLPPLKDGPILTEQQQKDQHLSASETVFKSIDWSKETDAVRWDAPASDPAMAMLSYAARLSKKEEAGEVPRGTTEAFYQGILDEMRASKATTAPPVTPE